MVSRCVTDGDYVVVAVSMLGDSVGKNENATQAILSSSSLVRHPVLRSPILFICTDRVHQLALNDDDHSLVLRSAIHRTVLCGER